PCPITIGPEPRMRMLWMSSLRGTAAVYPSRFRPSRRIAVTAMVMNPPHTIPAMTMKVITAALDMSAPGRWSGTGYRAEKVRAGRGRRKVRAEWVGAQDCDGCDSCSLRRQGVDPNAGSEPTAGVPRPAV